MSIDWWTLGLQAVNFLVLVWLLQRFLYRPVLAGIDARRAAMRRAEDVTKEARRAATAAAEAQAARLAEIDASRRGILVAADEEAKTRGERIIAQARAEAAKIIAVAREQIDRERLEAETALRQQAARLAGSMARRLLSDAPKPPPAFFLEVLAQDFASVPDTEIHHLRAEGEPIKVVCQPPLDDQAAALWRDRLKQRFGDFPITFASDPALLAGASITFAGLRLEASWAAALARAEKELTDDAQAG